MGRRISFSDPVKFAVIYSGTVLVDFIAERQDYVDFCETVTTIPCPEWVKISGMLNDFDANKTEICVKANSVVLIKCTDVNG